MALEENYRSTSRILEAAEAVISGNTERYEKRLRTSNPPGDRVQELVSPDALAEGRRVAELLVGWKGLGFEWSSMAVFFRVNHLSRGVETALSNAGIPYQLVSGTEFFERREVKDVLAYARLLENPRDEAAFARVVNAPRRGVGDGSLEKVRAHATAAGISVAEAATHRVEGVSGRARKGLDHLISCLVRLRSLPRSPVGPLLAAIATETGYRADLLGKEDDLERSRVENVDELVAAAPRGRSCPAGHRAPRLPRARDAFVRAGRLRRDGRARLPDDRPRGEGPRVRRRHRRRRRGGLVPARPERRQARGRRGGAAALLRRDDAGASSGSC